MRRPGQADQGATLPDVPTTLAPAWRIDIGGGFSSSVIATGKLVYLDARNDQEVIHVADPLSGKDLWTRPFADVYGDEWGSGPRCTPINRLDCKRCMTG